MWRGPHSAMVRGVKEVVRSDGSPQPVGRGTAEGAALEGETLA